jgi:hypothetical protein
MSEEVDADYGKLKGVRMDQAHASEARRIGAEMAAIAKAGVLPGSIVERRTHCGKPNCACNADQPKLHGPYYQWTRKVAAKTVGRWMPKEVSDDYRQWVDNAHRLRELVAALEALGVGAFEADPRLSRTARQSNPVD